MPTCTDTDRAHLARAIELAKKGEGAVRPNPVVGAVVARDGEILGEGWHKEFGAAHAEVNAIEACGLEEDLSGATLYVSLEPCCHEGKTPPCTEVILQARVQRVVIAAADPTPCSGYKCNLVLKFHPRHPAPSRKTVNETKMLLK